MRQPKDDHRLRVEVEAKGCTVSAGILDKMNTCLGSLRRITRNFPVGDLYVSIYHHARGGDYHVKTSLVLMQTTLFTADHDEHIYPAFERCVGKLIHKVEAYQEALGNQAETRKQVKGTLQEVYPTVALDGKQLQESVAAGDYAAFRRAMFPYEESVRDRAARWVERYPQVQSQLGKGLTIEDLVEEVFLNAFDRFDRRPAAVRLGEWLEGLIDTSIHALETDPDGEKENIAFARTLTEAG